MNLADAVMGTIDGAVKLVSEQVKFLGERTTVAVYHRENIDLYVLDAMADSSDLIVACAMPSIPSVFYLVNGWAFAEFVIDHDFVLVDLYAPRVSGTMKASVKVEGEFDAATQTFTGTVHLPLNRPR